jgi:hypothetical protein
MTTEFDQTSAPRRKNRLRRVRTNAQITGILGAALLVLFAAEGFTVVLGVRSTLPSHVFLGMVAIPPVMLKLTTTTYRFARYYLGDPAYVDRGPPPWLLRLVGPVVALSALALLATGIADAYDYPSRQVAGGAHKVAFVLWFGATAIHVLGHLRETPKLAFGRRDASASDLSVRITALGSSLIVGVALGVWSLGWMLPR